jgi:glycerate 2-kinase
MIPAESFLTSSLELSPDGEAITRILAAAIAAVDPGEALRRFVRRDGEALIISGRSVDLTAFNRVALLGIGKAAIAMATGLSNILGASLSAGLVITKHADEEIALNERNEIQVLVGDHPIPDERSLLAGEKVFEFLRPLGPDDLLFCLISGGGSALVTAPVEGVSLAELQALTSTLLGCGARVDEINCLRRRLDSLKGGGVACLANGATVISLILSDVVGSPLEAIASGPTAPDPGTRAAALSILEKYDLEGKLPASIPHALKESPEPPGPDDPLFDRVQNILIGSNLLAAQAALKQAEEEGFHPYLLRADLQGEARQAAFELATFLRQSRKTGDPVPPPACIIAGGETTVTLVGDGKGGRNTELALAAVTELADFPGVMLVTLATDGEDGPTDAAGAVVTGGTYRRARDLEMNPQTYLDRNDSYPFFEALGDLLKPGSTGTNVNDLTLLFSL